MSDCNVEVIELIPTWVGVLPILVAGLQAGDSVAVKEAQEQLLRMAQAADKWNAAVREEKAGRNG